MPERPPGFFEKIFGSKKPAELPPAQTEREQGLMQNPVDFLTRETYDADREQVRREELAQWVRGLEQQLSLPEGRLEGIPLEIGGKIAEQYEAELTEAGYEISVHAKQILNKANLSKERQKTDVVRLTVADLGFSGVATNEEIWNRGKELGLDFCPPDVGPKLRLSMKDQPQGDYLAVAMEPIADSDGHPCVFGVDAYDGCRWLADDRAYPGRGWNPDVAFAFARRKPQS